MEQPIQPRENPAFTDPVMLARKVMSVELEMRNGITTFNWIGMLSVFNTLSYFAGAHFSFPVGLGVTQLIDTLVKNLGQSSDQSGNIMYFLALLANVLIAGVFIFIGQQGLKRNRKMIIAGMAAYAVDGIVMLFFQIWIGFLFHAWFLFNLWKGYQALGELEKLEGVMPSTSMDTIHKAVPSQAIPSVLTPEQKRSQNARRIIILGLCIVLVILCVIGFYTIR
jgi:hypothetical protein